MSVSVAGTMALTPVTTATRAEAAFIGALCSDAAAQTSHWNYNKDKWHSHLRSQQKFDRPEFIQLNTFYCVPPGGQSCYGDQCLEYARHYAEHISTTSAKSRAKLIERLVTAFGDGSAYGAFPAPEVPRSVDGVREVLQGPWRHGSLKGFLKNTQSGKDWPDCGSDDAQADCFLKIIPVVCAYAGRNELAEEVVSAVRTTQNHDTAVQFGLAAARILEACILGRTENIREIILTVSGSLPPDGTLLKGFTSLVIHDKADEHTIGPKRALELVDELLELAPPSFEDAVSGLGAEKEMRPLLKHPVSLVA